MADELLTNLSVTLIHIALFSLLILIFIQIVTQVKIPDVKFWLITLSVLMIIRSVGNIGEYYLNTPESKYLFKAIKYFGISGIGPVWAITLYTYTGLLSGKREKFSSSLACVLFILPVLFYAGFLTNDYHHLFYTIPGTIAGKGPIFWSLWGYSALCILAGLYKILIWLHSSNANGRHLMIVFFNLITFLAIIANIMHLHDLTVSNIEMGYIFSGLMLIVFSYGIRNIGLLRWVPITKNEIVDNLPLGLIILDRRGELISINSSAQSMLGVNNTKGNLSNVIEKLSGIISGESFSSGFCFDFEHNGRFFSCELMALPRPKNITEGFVLTIRDKSTEHDLSNAREMLNFTIMKELLASLNILISKIGNLTGPGNSNSDMPINITRELKRASARLMRFCDYLEFLENLQYGNEKILKEKTDIVPLIKYYTEDLSDLDDFEETEIVLDMPESIEFGIDRRLFIPLIEGMVESITFFGAPEQLTLKSYLNEDGIVLSILSRGSKYSGHASSLLNSFSNFRGDMQQITDDPKIISMVVCRTIAEIQKGKINAGVIDEDTEQVTIFLPDNN
ncbi:MAG TPA: histidine kinase N-terminal 7TM domain-containing protein [bacterium]|nr:histidine kinase N-terminal 7TM domain-containing protein [bacterium]